MLKLADKKVGSKLTIKNGDERCRQGQGRCFLDIRNCNFLLNLQTYIKNSNYFKHFKLNNMK